METVVGENPADLKVLTVFANAVFEPCPDYGLTWWEFTHCDTIRDLDNPKVNLAYLTLADKDFLELIPVSDTYHAKNAKIIDKQLHPGERIIRITEKGMKNFGKLVSKAMKDCK